MTEKSEANEPVELEFERLWDDKPNTEAVTKKEEKFIKSKSIKPQVSSKHKKAYIDQFKAHSMDETRIYERFDISDFNEQVDLLIHEMRQKNEQLQENMLPSLTQKNAET